LEPLWPGSRKTIIPAMFAGAADAGLAGVETATSRPVAIAAPTRRQAGTCTGVTVVLLATRLKPRTAAWG
jgi:hypothetical protein